MDEKELAMWQAYRANPDDSALRNCLIEFYMPLVSHQAKLVQSKSHNAVDLDFLCQAGVFGLMDAIEGFDIARGLKFSTYAVRRISGSMVDEIRNFDWVPRLVRKSAAKVQQLKKDGVEPPDNLLNAAHVVNLVSDSKEVFETDIGVPVTVGDGLISREPSPFESSQKADLLKLVTKGLSKRERLIVILSYYEGQTLKQIGEQLGISESRVSQIHTDVMKQLRARLKGREEEFV